MKTIKFGLAAASLCLLSGIAHAEVQGIGDAEGWLLGLGLIADFPAYEGTESPETLIVPYVAYEWENAHLGIDGFSYDFFGTENLELTALVEPRWSFTDPDDSSMFEGIERDTALEAGLAAKYSLGNVYVEGRALQDLSGVHKGHEGSIKAAIQQGVGPLLFDLGVGATYRSDKLNQHLYGVNADEATATLAQFTTDDTFQPFVETNVTLPIGDSMALIAFGKFEKFDDDIKDSPLVSRDSEGTVGLLFLQQF